jgi:hypothetical protein
VSLPGIVLATDTGHLRLIQALSRLGLHFLQSTAGPEVAESAIG